MPVITFANTGDGAGKTTAVLLLATELARYGNRVTVLDADPQSRISRWHDTVAPLARLNVIPCVTQANIESCLSDNRATSDYCLIDLPGTRSPLLAKAIGLSDHVLIPIQGGAMDGQGGAHVLQLLQYLQNRMNLHVPHSVVLTRVNALITAGALGAVKALLAQRDVDVLETPISERSAFRDVFDGGGTLYSTDPARIANLDKARENARLYAADILRRVPLVVRRREDRWSRKAA